jgi:hypothetical protein
MNWIIGRNNFFITVEYFTNLLIDFKLFWESIGNLLPHFGLSLVVFGIDEWYMNGILLRLNYGFVKIAFSVHCGTILLEEFFKAADDMFMWP